MAKYNFPDVASAQQCADRICRELAEKKLFRAFKPNGWADKVDTREDFIFKGHVQGPPVIAYTLDTNSPSIKFEFGTSATQTLYRNSVVATTRQYGGIEAGIQRTT